MVLRRGDFESVLAQWPSEEANVRKAYRKTAFIAIVRHTAKEHGVKTKEKKSTIMDKWVACMDTGKTTHLGLGDTNPDWDGKEHLSLEGLVNYKVDFIGTDVRSTRGTVCDTANKLRDLLDSRPLFTNRSEGKESGVLEPSPEPEQKDPASRPLSMDQLKPFLKKLESLHDKVDKLLERGVPSKIPTTPQVITALSQRRGNLPANAPWPDRAAEWCSRMQKRGELGQNQAI